MIARLATVAIVLTMLSVWTYARPQATNAPVSFASVVPLVFDDWVGRDAPPLDAAVARVLAADEYVHRYYGIGSRGSVPGAADPRTGIPDRRALIEMDIAYYARPQAGATMHSPLNCLPGNGWQVVDSRATTIGAGSSAADIRRIVVARGVDRVAMNYWFQNRGAVVPNEYRQRLQLVKNGFQGRPADAALVRVMALDTSSGHEALERFTRELLPLLNTSFR